MEGSIIKEASPATESHSSSEAAAPIIKVSESYGRHRKEIYSHPEGGEKLIAEYDDFVDHYNKDAYEYGYMGHNILADALCEYVTDKSLRILDVASGTGLLGQELKGRGYTCIDALEPSKKSLDVSRQCEAYTEYICDTLDARHQTNIPDDQYDALVVAGAFGVPGHVDDSCFPEIIRIIKPGGYFMFTISDEELKRWNWNDKLDGALDALTQKGLWELVEMRYEEYCKVYNQKAKIPVLKIL